MTSILGDQTLVPDSHCYTEFLDTALKQKNVDFNGLLATIPRCSDSYGPLATLSALLEAHEGSWPLLQLQRTYTELWKLLPEAAKAGRAPPAAQRLLEHALQQCKTAYSSLINFYHPASTSPAIIDPEDGRSASHSDIASVVRKFVLPHSPSPSGHKKPVVAISLPNGPLLALTVLCTAAYYIAAPVAHGSGVGREQFKADVLQSKSNIVLAARTDVDRLGLHDPWLEENSISVYLVELSEEMNLIINTLDGRSINRRSMFRRSALPQPKPNAADDIGILLFTSGTSGTKKLVPLSIHSMVCGVAMVEESWGLSPSMRCLNQMPLNHVGGLIRNLFAPIFSGGSVICCTAFDANLFWDCVEDYAPTWYYASPSMHQVILEAGAARPESVAKSRIRLVCNAAGGLLPSLAVQLRETFSTGSVECTVLPSYGMTECMPISTPPLDYCLEKPGTSGITVGPEIAILNGRDQPQVTKGEEDVGRIAVRGAPVFSGYLKDNDTVDNSCFTEDGWFDTGDMGYRDADGYLYITGRSKEVINRGGELISPFEVEEAITAAAARPDTPVFGRVSKCLAFSAQHDVLQEVVGLAVVVPDGARRPCLRSIHEAVKSELSQVKVPMVLVYMRGGLPANNNKVLRIKLAERLGLPQMSDSTSPAGRYFEADCPPPNTPLKESIGSRQLRFCRNNLNAACAFVVPATHEYYVQTTDIYPELVLAHADCALPESCCVKKSMLDSLASVLHGYDVPNKVSELREPLPRIADGEVDDIALAKKLNSRSTSAPSGGLSSTEQKVVEAFAQVLSIPSSDVSNSSDFFELGGDSMGAGRLLSALRKEYPLRLPINTLFTNPKVYQLARVIEERLPKDEPQIDEKTSIREPEFLPGCEETHSSTRPFLMFLQLLPIGLIYPMKRALTWTIFMYMLTETQNWYTNLTVPGRLLDLVISITIGRLFTQIVAPLVAIIFKWLLIGRYQEGLYPMWGDYHTKWWLVQKTVQCAGQGVFSSFNWTRVLYLRLLGAKVGKNVTIQKGVTSGEWDLLRIDDGAVLERCIVRPFAAERNTSMYLGKIHIGRNASIGLSSIVAAGTNVPENACIGPNSSSWEVDDADENNRSLASNQVPGPHWTLDLLVGQPLHVLVKFCGAIPWLACLVALVAHEPGQAPDMLREVLIWFASPRRVGYHYLALAANVALGPAFFFAAVLLVKKIFNSLWGPVQPSSVDGRSESTKFKMGWVRAAMPAPQFHKITELFGTHYETTSILARAMGAKVGRRVYWPGTGPSIQDFDLLDIGDDVVFGSRSHLVTSDGTGSDYVRIKSGAMVADRVVLLPGAELGEKTVMGSGALTKRNTRYAPETTWVGSKGGEAVCLSVSASEQSEEDTPKALGRLSVRYAQTQVPGLRRRSVRYSQIQAQAQAQDLIQMASMNSSSTSVTKVGISETSSLADLEKGPVTHHRETRGFFDQSKNDSLAISHPIHDTRSTNDLLEGANTKKEEESSSPFGRAFYEGKASYRVWGQFGIFLYSTLIIVANGIYWNIGSVSAVQIVARMYKDYDSVATHFLANHSLRPLTLYIFFTALITAIMALQSIAVVGGIIAAKWILMGRRQPGNYDWDKSQYCQRWQLFLKLETFRRHCYGGHGILGMLTGTHWITMYFRALGANIGKDCALFAGGLPSLMFTEPDCLTLGDRVAVDDASLVGHINTRGKFDLNPLYVGSRSVLRSGSRLLSGARMEEDSCLLEHTLVMAGDVVDAGATCQGWPAEEFSGSRMPTLKIARHWEAAS